MKKYRIWLAAVAAALVVTACGDGSGIEINGTKAGDSSSEAGGSESLSEPGSSGDAVAHIDIVTGETTAVPETPAADTTAAPETTAAETTAAPTTAAPTTAAPTTAAPTYSVRDVSKTMYATDNVRVRSSYSTSSEILGALEVGESVKVTGESENGWMRVSWNGYTAFVSGDYLTDTAPATTAASTTAAPTTAAPTTAAPTTAAPTTAAPTTAAPTTAAPTTTAAPEPTTSAGNYVTGTVVSLDPSGLTIQSDSGTTYQFVWGSSIPSLAAGQQVQVYYEGNTVISVEK